LSTNIYHITKTPSVKQRTTYAYEDDPTFLAFRSAVWGAFDRNDFPRLNNSKLYALWYCSNTFHRHWDEHPTKKTSEAMIFILGHNFLTADQGVLVMLAWMKTHFPNLNVETYYEWLEKTYWPTWERIQPSVQKARDRKNARRREKRTLKNMKTQNAKRKSSLKGRILEALTQHPMTTAVLATKLAAHPKAVDGHLSRMTKAGELVKLGRGLYALPGAVQSAPAQQPAQPIRHQPVNPIAPRSPAEPIILEKGCTDGIAEWNEPSMLEPADRYKMNIPDEIGVLDAPTLPTAEPNWNRKW